MKYPTSHLTPFLPVVPPQSHFSIRRRSLHPSDGETSKRRYLSSLRALELSCPSFSDFFRLFSIACGLFLQNTRGGVSSDFWPLRGSRFRPDCVTNHSISVLSVLSVPLWQKNLSDLHNFCAPINIF